MIIVDINQTFMSNLMVHIHRGNTKEIHSEDLLRHMILNSIRGYNVKFKNKYGRLVIAADDRHYWRKDVFPYYKANRKKSREESEIDWGKIFEVFHKLKDEIRVNFPYPYIQADGAEADDIIGVLCNYTSENTLIASRDEDFYQLHILDHVNQYNIIDKKFVKLTPEESKKSLLEKIVRGDGGDGVPNIFSVDNSFVEKIRQKSVSTKLVEEWKEYYYRGIDWKEFVPTEHHINFDRNKTLIDLSCTPVHIKQAIIDKYNSESNKDRSKLFNYFAMNNLRNLVETINDF